MATPHYYKACSFTIIILQQLSILLAMCVSNSMNMMPCSGYVAFRSNKCTCTAVLATWTLFFVPRPKATTR